MLTLPYGIADFRRIRREGLIYVDRTAHVRDLERLGSILVFLRPRRFGKSLWIQTLASYYDLRLADDFEGLFGGLEAGRRPTPLCNRYFVLQWNFSRVDASGDVRQIAESLREHVSSRARSFAQEYQAFLSQPVSTDGSADSILDSLLSAVRQTPHKLYLLIDEYDNFVNQVMAEDIDTYRALFGKEGPYKQLFKAVKNATEGLGLERVFVTGVAPVALNDLTSGFNNAKDVSHVPELAALCGFRAAEVDDLVERIARDRGLTSDVVDHARQTMRTWYNGYSFNDEQDTLLYNPTNVLYFLDHLHLYGKPPRKLHDQNLRNDRSKLVFLARTAAGAGVVELLVEGEKEEIAVNLVESFSVDDLTEALSKDAAAVASMLYYMGLLTRTAVPFHLRIPNLVVRKLFLERLLEIYLPDLGDVSGSRGIALSFFQDGDLVPLLRFFEEKLLPVLSNRDRGAAPGKPGHAGSGVNETVVKALFLAILFEDDYYRTISEPELGKEYADLCLLRRPEARSYAFHDLLFEFKLVRKKELALKGRELRDMDEKALRELPAVKRAFTEAIEQAKRYRAALVRREDELDLKTFAVVAVGLERMLGVEVKE